jgi:23S rRNA pseudouridine1911/1915/1917 synthase
LSGTVSHFLPDGAPRLDRFLAQAYPDLARSRWDAWVRAGRVRVDGQVVTKAGTRLRAGATVETELPEPASPALRLAPEAMDLPTLFEDARLWIIDKPSDLVVHPGPGHPSGTVLNALLARLRCADPVPGEPSARSGSPFDPGALAGPSLASTPAAPEEAGLGEEEDLPAAAWPGLVHRLDRYTTGCLAMAKDAPAQQALQRQFRERSVEKSYLALARACRKLPEVGSVLVDEPIARHRVERLKMVVQAGGRPAQTRVKVLARARGLALVECELLTGRTHQVRVHLAHLGAPILGDPLYGGATAWLDADRRSLACPHPMLHAWKLALDHPEDGRRLHCLAPLPLAWLQALEALGIAAP